MKLQPNINKSNSNEKRLCSRCKEHKELKNYAKTRSPFFPGGHITLCNSCVHDYLEAEDYEWDAVDRICRWADIPFIVKEWIRLSDLSPPPLTWGVYSKVFADQVYVGLGWATYNDQYKKLREVGLIEEEIPLVKTKRIKELQQKWGSNYSEEDLNYLEDLYKGLLATQNVSGALQRDQAQKLCKLSRQVDENIEEGGRNVDRLLTSYDKLIKTAEFTPRNAKNQTDFDSFSEVALWLEKRGNQNKFYDGTTRDIIDETIKNIQAYNQKLYVNEGGIGDEITERLQALKYAEKLENRKGLEFYDLEESTPDELDRYENESFTFEGDNEEFEP